MFDISVSRPLKLSVSMELQSPLQTISQYFIDKFYIEMCQKYTKKYYGVIKIKFKVFFCFKMLSNLDKFLGEDW